MQTTLALGGIGFELVGGFLLSIELIWKVDPFITHVDRFRAGARRAVPTRSIASAADRETRIYGYAFRYGGFALLLPIMWLVGTRDELYDWLPSPWWSVPLAGLWGALVGVVLWVLVWMVVAVVAAVASTLVRMFLWWITRGDRARSLGQLGFVLLFIGLTMQGVVNYMQGSGS